MRRNILDNVPTSITGDADTAAEVSARAIELARDGLRVSPRTIAELPSTRVASLGLALNQQLQSAFVAKHSPNGVDVVEWTGS
jgi:hypothetical protein